MTADEFREALETELAWRQEEYAFFRNQQNEIMRGNTDRYRKGLVLILYAQMEGYLNICLQTYVQFINAQRLTCGEVSIRLRAGGMQSSLAENGGRERKSREICQDLPEDFLQQLLQDSDLHRFYQQVDLMEKAEESKGRILKLDDQMTDRQPGCGYDTLQKNLYQLGLPVDLFDRYQEDLNAFANRRDAIAQGIFRSGVTRQELEGWESKAGGIASGVMRLLYDYVKHEKYRTRNV